jgi:hypothetical protein
MMVKLSPNMIQTALVILNQASTADSIKAADDYNKICNAQQAIRTNGNQAISYAQQLDNYLRIEYPTIGELESIANRIYNSLRTCRNTNNNSYSIQWTTELTARLQNDSLGIIASVLLKHRVSDSIQHMLEITQ